MGDIMFNDLLKNMNKRIADERSQMVTTGQMHDHAPYPGLAPYACPVCDQFFKLPGELRTHLPFVEDMLLTVNQMGNPKGFHFYVPESTSGPLATPELIQHHITMTH
jgi:hypothetical protein